MVGRGDALREAGVSIEAVYSSPAFRCVQTAGSVIEGYAGSTTLNVNIEPGLIDFLQWYRNTLPSFMRPDELKENGYPVNMAYEPITRLSSLPETESLEEYYDRSFCVMKGIVQRHSRGTILIVAHAESLETCTRQLCGGEPRSFEQFWYLIHHTPYVGCLHIVEKRSAWQFAEPPIPPLTHAGNATYFWRQHSIPVVWLEKRMSAFSR
ncbi:hypothetical protein Q1695_004815 [Nippostrongylus brasiliensis]|nr:hypothetical protein Q1695_004815 [Nippostrongylus brasiliensis]